VKPYWADLLRANPHFVHCGEEYFQASRGEIERVLSRQLS